MQAALSLAPVFLPSKTPIKISTFPLRSIPARQPCLFAPIKAAAVENETPTADYSSVNSVFPAEACETVGGEACDVEMYPEVKLKPETQSASKKSQTASEQVDREYLEYNSPKTVFPGDACDELGGEFCQPEYQSGVYK